MAQHDYVIANGTGAAVRSDLNNALAAIVSQNSGATAPSPTYAYQFWADTTTGLLKLRNAANSAWITLFQLDGEWSTLPVENGTAAAPSIYFKDSGTDTGFYSPGTDQVAVSTAGTGRLFINSSGSVGIGTSSPSAVLHISSASPTVRISDTSGTASNLTGQILFQEMGTTSAMGRIGYTGGDAILRVKTDGAQPIAFLTNDAERVRITSGGNVGIGVTSPAAPLDLSGDVIVRGANSTIRFKDSGNTTQYLAIYGNSTDANINAGVNNLVFYSAATERARFDGSGRLLVGTSTNVNGTIGNSVGWPAMGQFSSTSTQNIPLGLFHWSTYAVDLGGAGGGLGNGPDIVLGRSNSNNKGEHALVTNNMLLGRVNFSGSDGTQFLNGACIAAAVDGTPGTNDMPGRLVFSTTADGASSPTERMRIDSSGYVTIYKNASNLARLNFEASSTRLEYSDATGHLSFYTNSSARVRINYGGGFVPVTDNSQSLGSSSERWTAVYAVNGTIQTSDLREKTDVATSSLGTDFIKQLRPVSYKFKVGENVVTKGEDGETDIVTPRPGERTHWGFIAQEVKEVVDAAGVDFGGWILTDKDDPDSTQGLRYDQFIAPLTKALQEALAEIDVLKAKVAALESA